MLLFFCFLFFCFLCFFFQAALSAYGGVPRLGVESELPLPAFTTATATRDPSHICLLHHTSQQPQIPDTLSKARDRTHLLMDTSQICFCCATMVTLVVAFLTCISQIYVCVCIYIYMERENKFLKVTVTNYHKLGGLKQEKFILLQLGILEVWNKSSSLWWL